MKNNKLTHAEDFGTAVLFAVGVFLVVFIIAFMLNITPFILLLFKNYKHLSQNQFAVLLMTGLLVPWGLSGIIALKQMLIQTYSMLYKKLIKKYWIRPFAIYLTTLIWEQKNSLNHSIGKAYRKTADETSILDDIEVKAFLWLNAKIYALPTVLAKVLTFFLKKTPIGAFIAYFDASWMQKIGDRESMITELEAKMDDFMQNVVKNAFPFWIKWIIPLNMAWLIFLCTTL